MQKFQFHPAITGWLEEKFGTPTEAQERGWPAIQSGTHTLIAAPTGSGKTLAAFLAALDQLFRDGLAGTLPDETRVLYVSPLKALSNDIHKNLEEPLAAISAAIERREGHRVEVRAEVRTGDTPAAKRRAILKKPPHILVTTPESFYLLLTSATGRKMLSTVRTLIVDEIHAVAGQRRGSHLSLSMERLGALASGPVQRIGLSATQRPIEEVARFLVGNCRPGESAEEIIQPPCVIIDAGHRRQLDLGIELPGSPLEAVMSNEVWGEVYQRLAELIEAHRTTLIFVNTRRLAERVTHQLSEKLGVERVTSHHGSLSAKLRLDAENRLKRGELRALVATASLELGIDIGAVDLVCQLGPTRSIATFLQRVGRAGHQRGGLPKGRIFPLTRDELVECLATIRSVRRGELDCLEIPPKPLDILAQQIVACASCEDCSEQDLLGLVRRAYPYRSLRKEEFEEVVRMLADGFTTKRGRRAALIHYDAINGRIRGRRGAGLIALTSGGAIPDNADYRVVLDPTETFLGTVNEDFAIESMAGDIFQLGNASWKIVQVNSGVVRVQDAHGQPPNIPFWLGEAPGRTRELSEAVSALRGEIEEQLRSAAGALASASASAGNGAAPSGSPPAGLIEKVSAWLSEQTGLSAAGAWQVVEYFWASYAALGVVPSQDKVVLERFFDESGGMQLVIHAPFGSRLNRAWGLALRKRFCRSFNFELQAAATDDAIVLSLGTQHSFPLEEVFRYLHSRTVRDLLVQAIFDAPVFAVRWRWNASRALALPRQRGGLRIPAPLQRMEAENLIAAVFPDQLACLENIAGDREVPNHPLVRQTIEDCLTEAMDVAGLEALLSRVERGEVECLARDLPEPSPMAHEILNAKPYAFLDNAPLEERRTQAVYTRRTYEHSTTDTLGRLDPAAIERVRAEARPRAVNADELHEALLLQGTMTGEELSACCPGAPEFLAQLSAERRAGQLTGPMSFWIAAERLTMVQAVYPDAGVRPEIQPPAAALAKSWDRDEAIRELVRGCLEVSGPIPAESIAQRLQLTEPEIQSALLALESEGFLLRGKFNPDAQGVEWCERRLLARIHRLTLNRLRAEIQPVSVAEFQRFLLQWQRVAPEAHGDGSAGVMAVLESLDGFELPAAAWEPEVLARRVNHYTPQWLDQLCFAGRAGWGRLSPPQGQRNRVFAPVRSSPISLFSRDNLAHWLALSPAASAGGLSPDTGAVLNALAEAGASFFAEIVQRTALLPSRVETALGELAALGWVTADSFEGLRALLLPSEKRIPFADTERRRHHRAVTSIEFAGRWTLLRPREPERNPFPAGDASFAAVALSPPEPGTGLVRPDALPATEAAKERFARVLLRRYGVVFRRLLEREALSASWFDLGRVYRRLEARGEIRGGHFVAGMSGEQFALPEAIGLLRSVRKSKGSGELISISAADPLNLVGILTPGSRIPAYSANQVLLRDGEPIAALEAGQIRLLTAAPDVAEHLIAQRLKIGELAVPLRPYYA